LTQVARLADPENEALRISDLLERGQSGLVEQAATELAAAESLGVTPATLIILDQVSITPGARQPVEGLLKRVHRRYPGDFWLNVYLGFMNTEKSEERFRYLSMALAIRPDSPGIHKLVAKTYAQKGLLDEAIAQFREQARLIPESGEPHINIALAFINK